MSKTVYGFCEAGCKYPVVSKDDVPYKMIEISKEDYDALSDEEKNFPGVMYVVDEPLVADEAKKANEAAKADVANRIHMLTNVGKSEASIPLGQIIEFDSNQEPTGNVFNAVKVTGTKLITSEATTVPISKAGLYVCTLAQYGSTGTVLMYYTVMISIPSVNADCETSFGMYGTVNDHNWSGMGKVCYWGATEKYLKIVESNSVYSYKFKDVRLLVDY